MNKLGTNLKAKIAGGILALALLVSVGSPAAFAQSTTPGTTSGTTSGTSAQQTNNNNDDGFPWGLLGLAGLAGLAGLKPKEQTSRVERVERSPGARTS